MSLHTAIHQTESPPSTISRVVDYTPDVLTIHLGCALSYFAEEPAQILFLVQPAERLGQHILSDNFTVASGAAVTRYADANGNIVLATSLIPGLNEFRHDARLQVPVSHEGLAHHLDQEAHDQEAGLPIDVVRYTLPSRYCESDKLVGLANQLFGNRNDLETVQKICDWTHHQLEYRYGSGSQTLSAWEAIQRRFGVCRDFAHVMVAMCRALDIPARYVAGHMPLIGAPVPDSDIGVDFHAYVEVYVAGAWRVFDPRYNMWHVGRVKIAHGTDAVDAAFATYFGRVTPVSFEAWSYAVDHVTPEDLAIQRSWAPGNALSTRS
jgi:transglutaminase-like putative cysteine protease